MNHELVKNEEKGKTSYDLKLHLSEDEFNFFAGIMTKLRPSDIYQVCGIPQKEYSLPAENGVSPELELDNTVIEDVKGSGPKSYEIGFRTVTMP